MSISLPLPVSKHSNIDLLLTLGLLLVSLLELETLLGNTNQLLALELLQLLGTVLVNGVGQEKDLEALLLQSLKEWRVLDSVQALSGQVVDGLLDLGHSGDVVVKGSHLLQRLGGVEPQELGELGTVSGILVNSQLQVLSESLVELGVVVLVLSDLRDHVHGLLDNVLPDDLQDLVLLQGLSRDVKGKILRVDDSLDEVEVLGDQVLTVVHDENTTNVELDVVPLLLGLEKVEGSPDNVNEQLAQDFQLLLIIVCNSPLGDIQQSLELQLSLDAEVLDGKVVLPVVAQALVESSVLLGGNILGVPGPKRLGLVQLLVLDLGLLDLLGLLGLLLVIDLLDLGALVSVVLDLLRLILDFFLNLLGNNQLDGVRDELGVLLDDLLDLLLLEVVELVLLQEQLHLGSSAQRLSLGIRGDGESTSGSGLPNVLLVIVVLGSNLDLLSDQVGRVETNTELSNHGDIGTGREGLHESLGSRLGDCSQVVNEVGLGHTDTSVSDGQGLLLLVGSDSDEHFLLRVQDGGVGKGLVSDLVEGIGRVGLRTSGKTGQSV
jgi:hypothetical protein